MSISPNLTQCAEVKLYVLKSFDHPQVTIHKLEAGLSVVLEINEPTTLNYRGGNVEYVSAGGECWVKIVALKGNWIIGLLDQDFGFLMAGSHFHFKPEHVMTISGSVDWQINNLSVWVSEKIVYNRERVGYFYYSGRNEDNPLDSGLKYYAESETHEPKDDISLVKVPLSSLVDYDPSVAQYLELVSIDGVIRTSDYSFEQYLVEPRDIKIYPRGYTADWEEEEENFLNNEADLPF